MSPQLLDWWGHVLKYDRGWPEQEQVEWMECFGDPPLGEKNISWDMQKTCLNVNWQWPKALHQNLCPESPTVFSSVLKWPQKHWKNGGNSASSQLTYHQCHCSDFAGWIQTRHWAADGPRAVVWPRLVRHKCSESPVGGLEVPVIHADALKPIKPVLMHGVMPFFYSPDDISEPQPCNKAVTDAWSDSRDSSRISVTGFLHRVPSLL